jgi:hypothetical protein
MDAATITAIATGVAIVLKALAVLVSAIRAARTPVPDPDATQDPTPETARV